MPGVHKGVLAQVDYSTDYVFPDGDAAATYVEIPVAKVIQAGFDPPNEEAVTQPNVNGADLQAGVRNAFVLPVVQDDIDAFIAALKTASSAHTPVWFRFEMLNQNPRIVGGRSGCQVTIGESQAAQFGDFAATLIGGTTTGADSGDTFEEVTGS